MTIEIITGDITEQDVDAIVNSAAPSMLATVGICGAIHKAAGAELEKECRIIGHVDAGNATMTAGYKLKAPYIIHAVAPQWFGGNSHEAEILAQCYHSIFGIMEMEQFRSIAIPAIGIGSVRYPIELATPIALNIAKEYEESHLDTLIRFVCFTDEIANVYKDMNEQYSQIG